MDTGHASFTLRLGKSIYKCGLDLPAGPVRVAELLPVLNKLAGFVVDAAVEEATEAGKTISCKAGCGACCRQPVPVSVHEAEVLEQVIAGMDAERKAVIEARFADAMQRMAEGGVLEEMRAVHSLDERGRRELSLRYLALGIACPFLEAESCSIYEQRPMRCREYLVTSPAENCSAPTPQTIKMVHLNGAPSQALYRLGAGFWQDEPEYLIMSLMADWKGQRAETPREAAPQILQTFLLALSGEEPRSGAKPE
jgi:Fe-S-cluster containining protein